MMIKANYAITVKVNELANAALPVAANTAFELGKFKMPIRGISNIYIANATADLATIQVRLCAADD